MKICYSFGFYYQPQPFSGSYPIFLQEIDKGLGWFGGI